VVGKRLTNERQGHHSIVLDKRKEEALCRSIRKNFRWEAGGKEEQLWVPRGWGPVRLSEQRAGENIVARRRGKRFMKELRTGAPIKEKEREKKGGNSPLKRKWESWDENTRLSHWRGCHILGGENKIGLGGKAVGINSLI